jgi:hypothetical protein
MISGRALHFVFKVADRTLTSKFYREILGMKVTDVSYIVTFISKRKLGVKLSRQASSLKLIRRLVTLYAQIADYCTYPGV